MPEREAALVLAVGQRELALEQRPVVADFLGVVFEGAEVAAVCLVVGFRQ